MNQDFSKKLKIGMLSPCSVVLHKDNNNNNKKLIYSDVTDLTKCCLKSCIEPVKFCHLNCSKIHSKNPEILKRCLLTCNNQRQLCIDNCRITTPDIGPDNLYINCSKKASCIGVNNFPDIDCVKKNKLKIFNCCRDNCIPKHNLNCQKHCEFLQKVTIDPSTVGIPKFSDKLLENISEKNHPDMNIRKKNNPGDSNNRLLLYIASMIFCLLILAFNIKVISHLRK